MEASERNDTKRNLTQLKRFGDNKKPSEEKEAWGGRGTKDKEANEAWQETAPEADKISLQVKQATEEKNKANLAEKKDDKNQSG